MIKQLPFILLIFAIAWSASMADPRPPKVFPYDYRVETLANGLKVIVVPMPSKGLISYYSIVRTAAAKWEPRSEFEPGHSGFRALFSST